jgi:hypothetical protein
LPGPSEEVLEIEPSRHIGSPVGYGELNDRDSAPPGSLLSTVWQATGADAVDAQGRTY